MYSVRRPPVAASCDDGFPRRLYVNFNEKGPLLRESPDLLDAGARRKCPRTNGLIIEVGRDVSKNRCHMESAAASSRLAELLASSERTGEALPLDRACLLVSAAIDPATDIAACESTLDGLARSAARAAAAFPGPYALPAALFTTLFASGGFRGDAAAYDDSTNSLLSHVIETRLGIPITLSIILMETARRAGLQLEGVGLPGHFVVRFPDPTSRLFIDPFNAGAVIDESDCRAIVDRIYGSKLTWRDDFLDSVAPRAILKRVVLNLKNALTGEKDYVTAL